MFKETSIIKEVNILNKCICYLMVIVSLFIIKDPVFLTFTYLIFLLLSKGYRRIFIVNILMTLFSLYTIIYPQYLWISKIFFLVLYTILLKNVTNIKDLRYILEVTLYKFKNKKITYNTFYIIYFLKNFKKNFNRLLSLSDDYKMKFNIKYLFFIIKESYNKAKLERKNFEEINKLRFYNYKTERTYIEKIVWESWDITYLLCYVIILLIVIFYGR